MAELVTMPKLGFDMAEGTLVRWVKKEGETINKGEVLAEIETDKATVEVESGHSGTILRLLAETGDILPVNVPIAVVGAAGENVDDLLGGAVDSGQQSQPAPQDEQPGSKPELQPAAAMAAESAPEGGRIIASPLARRMAEENAINLNAIQGSGPGGRIVKKDIEAALQSPVVQPELASAYAPVIPVPGDEIVKTTRLRQAIGRRLVESKQQVPHFYVTHEYKMDALMSMRKQVNGMLPEGEKLSVNDFLVKAVALALREYPNLNASLDGDTIVRHGAVNIGNAVAVPGGLLTVVNKNADRKTLREISLEVRAMASRAREGRVKPEDIEGSTFSISNLGMYDVEDFIAIINPPEAAILAVGSAREVPVVENGAIVPGWRMKATISVDHRISDGAEAAQFMQAMAKYIEEPLRLLVG